MNDIEHNILSPSSNLNSNSNSDTNNIDILIDQIKVISNENNADKLIINCSIFDNENIRTEINQK